MSNQAGNSAGGPKPIVAGIDGTDETRRAAYWAAREASTRNLPLHLLTAYSLAPSAATAFEVGAYDSDAWRDAAEQTMHSTLKALAESEFDCEVHGYVVAGDPVTALVEASANATMVVIGSKGLPPLAGRLITTVSMAVMSRAECPVVVVPHGPPAPLNRVLVGVDDTESSLTAASWAAKWAAHHGTELELVSVVPPSVFASAWSPAVYVGDDGVEQTQQELDKHAQELREANPGLVITAHAMSGQPIDCLNEKSFDACLVVLGSRGHEGFRAWLGGATAKGIMKHATTPMAVLPRKYSLPATFTQG